LFKVGFGIRIGYIKTVIISEVIKMKLMSPAFEEGAMIPPQYTCDDKDVSPPLEWSQVPEGTKTFALICDDPDAPMGTWVHWVAFNLPGSMKNLAEDIPPSEQLPDGTKQGRNDFRRIGYGGPCPPGGTHRYYFKLYALESELRLKAGCTKAELLEAMEGHILAECQLMGKYSR
jgi:Raf kinase inhibitor-like YbhB/YbcL family protein